MPSRTDTFDLGTLRMSSGEGRSIDLEVAIDDFDFGGQRYTVEPRVVGVRLDISRMTHGGYALRVRLRAALAGPCMRCLEAAEPEVDVDAREVDQPSGGEDLSSPYVQKEVLDLAAWARDALALALPPQLLCRADCAGLCPVCGKDLNVEPHAHEEAPADTRWAALEALRTADDGS
jgi:uncharacterized protein